MDDITYAISFLERWTRLKKVEEDGVIRYTITTELPPAIKIERRAELIPDNDAIEIIQDIVERIVQREVKGFRLLFSKEKIENNRRIKILVLLEKPDFDSVYPQGFLYKNTLFLLYPGYSLKSDEVVGLAKRIIASRELSKIETEAEKMFDGFHREYVEALRRQINNAGWILQLWVRTDLKEKPHLVEKKYQSLKM
jgi:hypothetical protein